MIWDFVIVFIALMVALILITSISKGAPYVPTHNDVVEKMLKGVGPGTALVDLGSGDGRIVVAAALKGASAVGFEINPILVLISRYRIKKQGLNAQVYWKSFWPVDLSPYNMVTVFGITKIMPELEKKLTKELKPGARVVSYAYDFPNWPHTEKRDGLYFYSK